MTYVVLTLYELPLPLQFWFSTDAFLASYFFRFITTKAGLNHFCIAKLFYDSSCSCKWVHCCDVQVSHNVYFLISFMFSSRDNALTVPDFWRRTLWNLAAIPVSQIIYGRVESSRHMSYICSKRFFNLNLVSNWNWPRLLLRLTIKRFDK